MNRFVPINPTIALAVLLALLVSAPMSIATSSKSPGSAATPADKSGGDSAGITGGPMAIESIIFAYSALTADADKMAQAISPRVSGQVVVIATPTDFANLLQWRVVMAQADLLHSRAQSTIESLKTIPIPEEFGKAPQGVASFGAGFLPSAADALALVQTVASMFAVNESLSVASAALTSTPLANLLAARLSDKGAAVYIPATYPPGLLQRSNLDETFIGKKLNQLEDDRKDAIGQTERYLQALADAEQITISRPSVAEVDNALRFKNLYKNKINARIAALVPIVEAIDNFEATLLTGQASSVSNPPESSTGKKKPADPPKDPPAESATGSPQYDDNRGPASGTGHPSPTSNPPNPSTGKKKPGDPPKDPPAESAAAADDATSPKDATPKKEASPAASTLQQILLADLLAHQIWDGVEAPGPETLKRLHILVLQTLESGGNQLTKSSLWTGSRIYFSGGAVSTFSLYSVDGALECGGYAYAYRGYAKNSDFTKALDSNTAPSGAVESNCRK